MPLSPSAAEQVGRAFNAPTPDSLKCSIEEWRPSLDFTFRFDSGYIVRCRLGVFEGKKSTLAAFARVTPEGKASTLLGESVPLPELPQDMAGRTNPSKVKTMLTVSGAFAVGEGNYTVEILIADNRNRTRRKRWKLHVTASRSQRSLPLAIQPQTVEPLIKPAADIVPAQCGGSIRLTVLLDAAPMNPFRSQLRAWDRAFLLESLYSLLRQTPYKAVRVVAFNLEQQREIFRHDHFDGDAFIDLAHALQSIETGSVSVQALQRRNSPEFLIELVSKELAETEPSDAVVFLGPSSRIQGKVAAKLLPERTAVSPPFFYFAYFPWPGPDFPDGIAQLTRALDGKTYSIHSPAELGQSIRKMLVQLKQE